MAYSDFTMSELAEKFGIREKVSSLFGAIEISPLQASQRLKEDLSESKKLPFFSEKAKSELIITPILREIWRLRQENFQLFSGYSFNVSDKDKLTGICDYLFSTEKTVTEVFSAVFCIVEAKNRSVMEGVPQAFAEMYAAQIFNERHHKPTPIVYGCVTNATEWLFLKLDGKQAIIDMDYYHIDTNLPILLGVLNHIVGFYIE